MTRQMTQRHRTGASSGGEPESVGGIAGLGYAVVR